MKDNSALSVGMSDHARFMEGLRHDRTGFERLATHLKSLAGINLPTNDKNLSLMASRLGFFLKDHNIANYAALAGLLSGRDPRLVALFVEALTTNTTEFFRESTHFAFLQRALPEMLAKKQASGHPELRFWCSAASTGQEPYTMLMVLLESMPNAIPGYPQSLLKFLASDIDLTVLRRAASGIYSEAELRGVPPGLKPKYFSAYKGEGDKKFIVRPEVRRGITFAKVNLMSTPYPFQHRFDVIFCRNVLIYFERAMALAVTSRLLQALAPGGYLFLGHSEAGLLQGDGFKSVAAAIYQKNS